MIVLLLEQHADEFSLPPKAVSRLARLGITSASLARDEHTVAVVLEGWLFDPLGSARAAANAIGAEATTRTLHPVMQLAITTPPDPEEAQIAHHHS